MGCPVATATSAIAVQQPNGTMQLLRQGISTGLAAQQQTIMAQAVDLAGDLAVALVRIESTPRAWRLARFEQQADGSMAQTANDLIVGLSPFFSGAQGSPDFSMAFAKYYR